MGARCNGKCPYNGGGAEGVLTQMEEERQSDQGGRAWSDADTNKRAGQSKEWILP